MSINNPILDRRLANGKSLTKITNKKKSSTSTIKTWKLWSFFAKLSGNVSDRYSLCPTKRSAKTEKSCPTKKGKFIYYSYSRHPCTYWQQTRVPHPHPSQKLRSSNSTCLRPRHLLSTFADLLSTFAHTTHNNPAHLVVLSRPSREATSSLNVFGMLWWQTVLENF